MTRRVGWRDRALPGSRSEESATLGPGSFGSRAMSVSGSRLACTIRLVAGGATLVLGAFAVCLFRVGALTAPNLIFAIAVPIVAAGALDGRIGRVWRVVWRR